MHVRSLCSLVAVVLPLLWCSLTPAQAADIKHKTKVNEGKPEVKLDITCKDDYGAIIKPATLTYTQNGKCCKVSPASGTVSATGKWTMTFTYEGEGTDTIEITCGAGTWKLILTVQCIKKPKKVITGENSYLPPDDGAFQQMVETQDGLVESFLAALGQEPDQGAADEHLQALIDRLSGIDPVPEPMHPVVIFAAIDELQSLLGAGPILPEMMPITEFALDMYDLAATRNFQSGDCNGNGLLDFDDLGAGTSSDENGDLVPDDCNCPRVLFDADGDEDVDMVDFGVFQACWTGPELLPGEFNTLPLVCRCVDAPSGPTEPNGVINQDDLAVFLLCVTGPAASPDLYQPDCDGD